MDKGFFNFSDLLRMQTHENKHKLKPTQFISVASGVKKRVACNIQNKRRTRLSHFDNFRNLPQCKPPVQEALTKTQQRMLQLQKWKEEKERKKKEAMANKKKPFVVGIAKHPLKFELPPSIEWPLPSSSGRVTRSQSARSHISSTQQGKVYTFAPKNAVFNPMLRDLDIPTTSIFGQEKLEPNKKEMEKIKSKNVPKSNAREPRSLRNRTKVADIIEVRKTPNPSTVAQSSATEKSTTKKKLAKKPVKEANTVKSKVIATSTASSSNDSYEKSVKKTRNRRKSKKTGQTIITTIITTKNKKLVDISDSSTSMETDFEKPAKISTPKYTVTPNKSKIIIIEDFITFTPKNPLPKSESSSEEKLRSSKAMDAPVTPQQMEEEERKVSPRVYLSRGKENMRKEMKQRINEGLLDADVCDMSVEHFNTQLDSEIIRMTELCKKWDKILEEGTLPDEIQEEALAAVGQARLLMSQKLQQFAALLRQCARPEPGHSLVTTADLQGFWDMAFLQIDNVDVRFKKLEESRARGWAPPTPPAARRRRPPSKPPAPLAAPLAAPHAAPQSAPHAARRNRLKDIIAAARKVKQASTNEATKSFEAGFFSVQSPVHSAAATPRRQPSLLQTVLSNEAKKSSAKSSYAMLRASLIGKNVGSQNESPCEGHLVTLTPINLGLTPGRSILKSNNNTSTKVISKQLHFALASSSDTASDSSPIRGDAQMSGVEILQDSDDAQCTSPAKLNNSEHEVTKDKLQINETLSNGDDLVTADLIDSEGTENRQSLRRDPQPNTPAKLDDSEPNTEKDKLQINETLLNADNLVTTDMVMVEGKENRRSVRKSSHRCTPAKLHHSEHNVEKDKLEISEILPIGDNLVTTDVIMVGDKKYRRSLRRASQRTTPAKLDHSEHKVKEDKLPISEILLNGDSLVTTDVVNEGKENRRSLRRSLRNARRNSVTTEKENSAKDKEAEDKENLAEDRENKGSRSLRNAECNCVTTDKENVVEDKENIRFSRRSARLQRQDALEIVTPLRNTRSRRRTVQTPASGK